MTRSAKNSFSLWLFSIAKALFLALIFCGVSLVPTWAEAPKPEDLTAEGALLMRLDTRQTLFEKNPHKVLYPASTTKLMTALLAVEQLSPGRLITAPANFPYVGGSMIQIKPGETFTREQLIEGLLVKSGNDAATLLAMEISGSVENFAKLMNERAKELVAWQTNFVNPHGLHDPKHYTTAYDLALIAQGALHDDYLRKVMGSSSITLPATNKSPKRFYKNTNRFMWDADTLIPGKQMQIPIQFDLVQGAKTGTTREAGYCLVSLAKIQGQEYLAIGLKSKNPQIYADLRKLLDYGLSSSIEPVTLLTPQPHLGSATVPSSKEGQMSYGTTAGYYTYKKSKAPSSYKTYERLHPTVNLPLKKGTIIGYLSIQKEGQEIAQVPIQSNSDLTPLDKKTKISPVEGIPTLLFKTTPQKNAKRTPFSDTKYPIEKFRNPTVSAEFYM